jgi:hypothetical protein
MDSTDALAFANKHDFGALYDAACLARHPEVPGALSAPLLWELARYNDPSVYPADVTVRWAAISALVHIAVMKLPLPAAD